MESIFTKEDLNRDTPMPLYFQLKCLILKRIQNGEFAAGETIPTEAELQETFGISRSTIRQAITELVRDGWLERKTSKGTFVKPRKSDAVSYIHSFEPFYQQTAKMGKSTTTKVTKIETISPQPMLADGMGLSIGEKVIAISRIRYAEDVPMVIIHNFLPHEKCKFVLDHDLEKESLYEILKVNPDTSIDHTKTIVSSELAGLDDSRLLNVKIGSPMLCFHTKAMSVDQWVIDFAFSRYRGDINKFEIDVRPDK